MYSYKEYQYAMDLRRMKTLIENGGKWKWIIKNMKGY